MDLFNPRSDHRVGQATTLLSIGYMIYLELTGYEVSEYILIYQLIAFLHYSWDGIDTFFDDVIDVELPVEDKWVKWMGDVTFGGLFGYFLNWMVPVSMGNWYPDLPIVAAIPLAMLYEHINDPWLTFGAAELSFVLIFEIGYIVWYSWGVEGAAGMVGGSVFIWVVASMGLVAWFTYPEE